MDETSSLEVGVAAEKRRLDFETIAQMSPSERKSEIYIHSNRVGLALDLFYTLQGDPDSYDLRNLPEHRWKDAKRVMGCIGEAAVEANYVLQADSDNLFYEFFLPEDESIVFGVDTTVGHNTILISYGHFLDLVENIDKPKSNVRQEIFDSVAHECAHLYVEKHYPKTDEKSLRASELLQTGDSAKYEKDRAEQFVNKFAEGYVAYKKDEFRRLRAAAVAEDSLDRRG